MACKFWSYPEATKAIFCPRMSSATQKPCESSRPPNGLEGGGEFLLRECSHLPPARQTKPKPHPLPDARRRAPRIHTLQESLCLLPPLLPDSRVFLSSSRMTLRALRSTDNLLRPVEPGRRYGANHQSRLDPPPPDHSNNRSIRMLPLPTALRPARHANYFHFHPQLRRSGFPKVYPRFPVSPPSVWVPYTICELSLRFARTSHRNGSTEKSPASR